MSSNRAPIRSIKKQRDVNSKDKYSQLYEKYVNGQFTYDAHCLIQKLAQKGKKQPHMEGVELYKILIQITKILMMNELQILFLGATVEEMKWKVIESCLSPYIEDFAGLNARLKADNYGKKMQLSLLLIAYIVKLYLNEDMSIFDFRLRELAGTKDYDKMYQEWVEKMKKNFKFSPKNMNKLFKELDIIRTKKKEELEEVNYNSKVEELFTKLIEYEPRDHASKDNRTPMEEDQEELIPASIVRGSSIQSIHSLGHRESFREILMKSDRTMKHQISFLRNGSQDEFMGE